MLKRTWLLFAQAVTVALALLFVVLTLKPDWLPRDGTSPRALPVPTPTLSLPLPSPLPASAVATLPAPVAPGASAAGVGPAVRADSFSTAARRAAPAVVSVTATRTVGAPGATGPGAGAGVPRLPFPFRERAPQGQRQVGLGSGVIVSPEGYLLTNHHVVEDAADIEVQLTDGRQTRARVVGSDVETDIAVLKIELDALPVIAFGDPRSLQVGDAVLAIGNPFDVGQTVTAGIVSALDRNRVSNSPFQNFIQTDAAINPGNSGGALIDVAGRLVGINTAIFSRSGGSQGIGFAVPVDTARSVMDALISGGEVRRGWIGVEPRDLSADLAKSLSLPVKAGVLIVGVLQGGPAARAGVRPGDVVVSIGGRAVASTGELLTAVAALAPDSRATVGVRRGDEALTVDVRVQARPKR